MTIQTVSERKNPLMGRDEYWLSLAHAGKATPRRNELLAGIASHLKAEKDNVIIDKIFPAKGAPLSRIKVLVYADKTKIPKEKLGRMKKEKKVEEEAGTEAKKEGK